MNADERSGKERAEQFHRWRRRKDRIARRLIAVGGLAVLAAMAMLVLYLLWVVIPLFLPVGVDRQELGTLPDWAAEPYQFLATDEQARLGTRLSGGDSFAFFQLPSLEEVHRERLVDGAPRQAVAGAHDPAFTGLTAMAWDDGSASVFRRTYSVQIDSDIEQRRIMPQIKFPWGRDPLDLAPGERLGALAVADSPGLLAVAGVSDNAIHIVRAEREADFLTGEERLSTERQSLSTAYRPTGVALGSGNRWLYVADDQGRLHVYGVPDLSAEATVVLGSVPITTLGSLLGGISVIAGDASGGLHQVFPVRAGGNGWMFERMRSFEALPGAITAIVPEQRRKGFIALDGEGSLGIYHSTAGRLVKSVELASPPAAVALSPRADVAVLLGPSGEFNLLELDNRHPEVSLSALLDEIWYENYPEPQYVWQSSAATNDFEPKFSLTPLVVGTLKSAFYAMLFAVPLALFGAAYTAFFMSPGLRRKVKPTIEIMAALPTVILGFLAGLWLAPMVEDHLAGILMIMFMVPAGIVLFAFAFQWLASRRDWPSVKGNEAVILVPVILALAVFAEWLAHPVEALFFGGDLQSWLSEDLGIAYDQRNALVVGIAMGFAVIPTIFSIAEDAIYGVPRTLPDGSLALGATRWQTLMRVVIPSASPGIFSALMIGLGRAVGETMIVLMATGNTPIMDWNIFEGMRTLAANIAIEMPESAVGSTHYRILFLSALVLFLFTFVVNTVAEIIRHRLRIRYSRL